ncbi:hypothetical protein PUN4_180016 [Paraburkholderia unamae]|nr:hypothetical protein PUN4_180016 [Paraburkholderia unamae]
MKQLLPTGSQPFYPAGLQKKRRANLFF